MAEGARLLDLLRNGRRTDSPIQSMTDATVSLSTSLAPVSNLATIRFFILEMYVLRFILPQGPEHLTQEQIDAGKGYGWQIDVGGNQTPDGYEEIFDELDVPGGDANEYYAANQDVPFMNCRYQHIVSSISPPREREPKSLAQSSGLLSYSYASGCTDGDWCVAADRCHVLHIVESERKDPHCNLKLQPHVYG